MELRSSGGAPQACRRVGVVVRRSGALEACCMWRDVEEAKMYLEMHCRRVDVEM